MKNCKLIIEVHSEIVESFDYDDVADLLEYSRFIKLNLNTEKFTHTITINNVRYRYNKILKNYKLIE
jgi:hypothetical protein